MGVSHRSPGEFARGDLVEALRNECLINGLNKLKDQKINLAVAGAEAGKTCDYILGVARRLFTAGVAAKRGHFKRALDLLGAKPRKSLRGLSDSFVYDPAKAAANFWLEHAYAITPLLMDVKGAAEHLAKRNLVNGQRTVDVWARKKTSVEASSSVAVSTAPWGWDFANGTNEVVQRWDLSMRMSLSGRIDRPVFAEMDALGFTNPLVLAWEVLPFSFVFDWFLQVGDYLNALTTLSGFEAITYRYGVETTYSESSTSRVSAGNRGNVWIDTIEPCKGKIDVRLYERTGNIPVGVSTLAGLRPVIGEGVNGLRRLITSLALFRGNAARLFRV